MNPSCWNYQIINRLMIKHPRIVTKSNAFNLEILIITLEPVINVETSLESLFNNISLMFIDQFVPHRKYI